jgi:lipoprotein-anchoring transpeptidase ErfK/SrfK
VPRSSLAAAAVALVVLVGACSGGGHASGGRSGPPGNPATTAAAPLVTITPANGSSDADPSAGITVATSAGTLTSVSVATGGDPVTGSLAAGGRLWRSEWALDVSQTYTVTVTLARAGGGVATQVSRFSTLTPGRTFRAEIFEGANQTYGVGMPIILYFNRPIVDKAAVERALQVTTSSRVVGAWYWDDHCNMATACAYFRPRDYWPIGTTVSLTGHLNGVEGAPGVYGNHLLTQTFHIGRALVAIGNTATHRTQIYQNGRLLYDWPISSGKPGDDTPDGSYLAIEKGNPVQMTGPGYSISVPWSVRFTFSGDYYHDAYWSVGQQGFENVSHGCVNLAPADAQTYYNLVLPGDPITIVGSPTSGKWDNGWTEWFLDWTHYVQGSSLHQAVEAGPGGSAFVNPASLPPSTASAPLQTAPANNAIAR